MAQQVIQHVLGGTTALQAECGYRLGNILQGRDIQGDVFHIRIYAYGLEYSARYGAEKGLVELGVDLGVYEPRVDCLDTGPQCPVMEMVAHDRFQFVYRALHGVIVQVDAFHGIRMTLVPLALFETLPGTP